MGFEIRFLHEEDYSPEQRSVYSNTEHGLCLAKITIDDFDDVFETSLSFWSKEDYQAHWREALERIVQGSDVSCLITSIDDPNSANFLIWWPLYRMEDKVIVQNQLFFLEGAQGKFDIKNPFHSVRKYGSISPDGQEISEWALTVDQISKFLERREV